MVEQGHHHAGRDVVGAGGELHPSGRATLRVQALLREPRPLGLERPHLALVVGCRGSFPLALAKEERPGNVVVALDLALHAEATPAPGGLRRRLELEVWRPTVVVIAHGVAAG